MNRSALRLAALAWLLLLVVGSCSHDTQDGRLCVPFHERMYPLLVGDSVPLVAGRVRAYDCAPCSEQGQWASLDPDVAVVEGDRVRGLSSGSFMLEVEVDGDVAHVDGFVLPPTYSVEIEVGAESVGVNEQLSVCVFAVDGGRRIEDVPAGLECSGGLRPLSDTSDSGLFVVSAIYAGEFVLTGHVGARSVSATVLVEGP